MDCWLVSRARVSRLPCRRAFARTQLERALVIAGSARARVVRVVRVMRAPFLCGPSSLNHTARAHVSTIRPLFLRAHFQYLAEKLKKQVHVASTFGRLSGAPWRRRAPARALARTAQTRAHSLACAAHQARSAAPASGQSARNCPTRAARLVCASQTSAARHRARAQRREPSRALQTVSTASLAFISCRRPASQAAAKRPRAKIESERPIE